MHLGSVCSLLAWLSCITLSFSFTFQVGIVVGNVGQCSEMEDAHLGHQLFANKLATEAGAMYFSDKDGLQHRILFDYTRYNDDCEQTKHDDQMQKLLHEDKVHFVFGSTPVFAMAESIMANDAGRLIYHCCVGPDLLYEQDMRYVYGIQSSNAEYSQLSLRSMVLAGNVQRLFIFYLEDNIFTGTTCASAVLYSEDVLTSLKPEFELVHVKKYSSQNASADPFFFEKIVAEAINVRADAVLGCDFKDPGIAVTRELHKRQYYLKALWLTVAPAHEGFVPALGPASEHALTAGQWHPAMAYADGYYGTTENYNADFEEAFQLQPSYVAAGASAASYSLAVAIQEAFVLCAFPNGVEQQEASADDLLFGNNTIQCEDASGGLVTGDGYARILNSLSRQRLNTFFGRVEFNRFRRNIAKQAATTQVQKGIIEAVLPLGAANRALVMPIPEPIVNVPVEDRGPARIGKLQKEAFIILVVVLVGGVLLICLSAFFSMWWWHRYQKQKVINHLVISPHDLRIIHQPMRRWDGLYESGKALYRNALVALSPLEEARLNRLPGKADTDISSTPKSGHPSPFASIPDPVGFKEVAKETKVKHDTRSRRNSVYFFGLEEINPYLPTAAHTTTPKTRGALLQRPEQRVQFEPSVHIDLDGTSSGTQDCLPSAAAVVKADVEEHGSGKQESISSSHPQERHLTTPSTRPSNPGSTVSVLSSPATLPSLTKTQVLKLIWEIKSLQHPSVVPVLGIVWALPSMPPNMPIIVEECQELGALPSVLENGTIELDAIKKVDIVTDLAQALAYLHAQAHLKPRSFVQPRMTNVSINRHFRAKLRVPFTAITDALATRNSIKPLMPPMKLSKQSFTAAIESSHHSIVVPPIATSDEELKDVQRYGIEVARMLTAGLDSSLSSERSSTSCAFVKEELVEGSILPVAQHQAVLLEHGSELAGLLLSCCAVNAQERPSFNEIHLQLENKSHNIIQSALIAHRNSHRHSYEKPLSPDELLFELFPSKVAEALKCGRAPDPEPYSEVSLFFSDVCGYTDICSKLATREVMDLLHRLYSRFDALAETLGLFKVETIGDGYFLVGNLKHPQPDSHARHIAQFAFGCIAAANRELICSSKPELGHVHLRVGVHAGPVMGAVVGTLNRRFGLFGDAVNVASRMESTSKKDHVQCSASFMRLLRDQWPECAQMAVALGPRIIKGKGSMDTFFLIPPAAEEQAAARP